nr:outer membrane beta-barrel protein [Hasllibacter sp. MH4015]
MIASTGFAAADEPYNWTGVTGGVAYGSVTGESILSSLTTGAVQSRTGVSDETPTSAYVGVNYQHGSFVIGGEITFTDYSSTLDSNPANTFDNLTEVRARLGYAFDRIHVYGTVGHAELDLNYIGAQALGTGTVYGLGAEYAVHDNVIVGLEYTQTEVSADFGAPFNQRGTIELEAARLRVGLRF